MTAPPDPQEWGISPGYHDYAGRWLEPPPETVDAFLRSMRAGSTLPPGAGAEPDDSPIWVVRPGEQRDPLGQAWRIETEDGGDVRLGEAPLPPDLPLGYHRLVDDDSGRARLLVVSPGRCHLPPELRKWGWAVQLYATRSRESWGIGDLADLRRLAAWSASEGAGMALVNPLHGVIPGPPQPSPYYPSSRCFRNPIYLRVEDVPGAAALHSLDDLAAQGRALNADRLIDRSRVWGLKSQALELLWARARERADHVFDAFVADGGEALRGFAVHCALSEHLGGHWAIWPEEYARPESPAVARFAAAHGERIRYHQWLQWLVERQLAAAGAAGLDLMQDLAIGVDPGGADAWLWQDTMCLDVRVGAPPDEFNRRGQDWGLPAFDPWRLRLAHYDPLIRTIRSGFRGAGGLRVDHVMGLFRLFWIPLGASPAAGTYVNYRYEEILDILALESHRAGAYVVGEDLGTVADYQRHELGDRDVLSYRLLWFEPRPPAEFPEKALAAVTTHDLPTIAGLWSGSDLKEQQDLGLEPNEEGSQAIREKLRTLVGAEGEEPAAEIVTGTYAKLAEAPSMLLTATLEDALGVEERPNCPGTVEERPNWSIALPMPIEEMEDHPTVAAVARALRRP